MAMTAVEKILARHSGRSTVEPGDVVDVELDTIVLLDMNFIPSQLYDIQKITDPSKIVVVFDHLVPARDISAANAHVLGREFSERFGVRALHDVGSKQGIVHQIISDYAYAVPGEMLVCADSHTCSGGAFNTAARGLGTLDVIQAACTGRTWFECGPTMQYELEGECGEEVAPKDVFLYIADRFGEHSHTNIEFDGSVIRNWSLNQRRTLSTMCAEIGAEFPIFPVDEMLRNHLAERGVEDYEPVVSDPQADILDRRVIDVSAIEPMVALPHHVVHNARTARELKDEAIKVQQCFIGSCANGTLEDLEAAARILEGHKVKDGVRMIVTPSSEYVHNQAIQRGYVQILQEAGAVVTASACGPCAGLDMGIIGSGERAITSSTRNFQGRMGSPSSEVFLASSATVAATAITGTISDPRDVRS